MAVLLTEDYQNWTEVGDTWTVVSGASAELESAAPGTPAKYSVIYKEFTLSAVPVSATLSVQCQRLIFNDGEAISSVALRKPGDLVEGSDSKTYKCIQDHTAEDAIHEPITGSDWANYWELYDAGGGLGSVWVTGFDYRSVRTVLLYEGSGTLSEQYVLDEVAITEHLDATGTYRLSLTVDVTASSGDLDSLVIFSDLSLSTGAAWEIVLDELAVVSEKFVGGASFSEPAAVVEHFDCVKTTAAVTKEEQLIAGIDDNTVLIFDTGTPDGYYETDDEDYGHPGMDKTLDEIQFESNASAPHTVTVRASVDSGLTWTLLGTVVAQRGKVCSVFACITAEKHRVCFRGNGLRLSSYTLYAIPRGKMAKVTP